MVYLLCRRWRGAATGMLRWWHIERRAGIMRSWVPDLGMANRFRRSR